MRIRTNDVTAYDGHLFAARCPFHVTKKKYEERLDFRHPEPEEDTLIVGEMDPPEDPPQDGNTPASPTPADEGPIVTTGQFGA